MATSWGFKKQWRNARYHTGDIYQDNKQERLRKEWEVEDTSAGPYLKHVKDISSAWPHLQLLADFMEVGTDPIRWKNFNGDDKTNSYTYPEEDELRKRKQSDRVGKTHVQQLKFLKDGVVQADNPYTNAEALRQALRDLCNRDNKPTPDQIELRLFVVEDLSREVIELLGYSFNIEPEFFRAHICDYVWFNIRDPFWDPPALQADIAQRNWFQIRFCRTRYFSSPGRLRKGQSEANKFNIGRRLYEDENKAFWDRGPESMSVARSQLTWQMSNLIDEVNSVVTQICQPLASIWRKNNIDEEAHEPEHTRPSAPKKHGSGKPFSDSTVEELEESDESEEDEVDGRVGLMRTRATFWRKKGEAGKCDVGVLLLDPTVTKGLPLWRGYRNWHPTPPVHSQEDILAHQVPSLVRNRSSSKASFFDDLIYWCKKPQTVSGADVGNVPTIALLRLACAEWLTIVQYIKTRLSQIDWEVTHPEEFLTQNRIDSILNKLHTWRRWVPVYREMLSETQSQVFRFHGHTQKSNDPASANSKASTPLDAYKKELTIVLKAMEEFEVRIDRLTAIVTSAINTADSRRVERITLLATLFVPLSLVGTLFSMSADIAESRMTFAYWAATSGTLLIIQYLWVRLSGWHRRH